MAFLRINDLEHQLNAIILYDQDLVLVFFQKFS